MLGLTVQGSYWGDAAANSLDSIAGRFDADRLAMPFARAFFERGQESSQMIP